MRVSMDEPIHLTKDHRLAVVAVVRVLTCTAFKSVFALHALSFVNCNHTLSHARKIFPERKRSEKDGTTEEKKKTQKHKNTSM